MESGLSCDTDACFQQHQLPQYSLQRVEDPKVAGEFEQIDMEHPAPFEASLQGQSQWLDRELLPARKKQQ